MVTIATKGALSVVISLALIQSAVGDSTAVQRDGIRASIIPRVLGHPYPTRESPDLAAMNAALGSVPNTVDAPHYSPAQPIPNVHLFGPSKMSLQNVLAAVAAATGYRAVFSNPKDRELMVSWVPHGELSLDRFLIIVGAQIHRNIPLAPDSRLIMVMPEVSHGG